MEITLEQALQKGIEAHKAGKFQEADRYYTAILNVNPKHSEANHNMGLLAFDVGKVKEALPYFKTALAVNPNVAQYWLSNIKTLIKLDKIEDAESVFKQAKSQGIVMDWGDQLQQYLLKHRVSFIGNHESQEGQSNILDELRLNQALNLAKKKAREGLSFEADQIYRQILKRFPKNKKAINGIRTNSFQFKPKTFTPPDPPHDQLQLLINQYNDGNYQQTLKEARLLLRSYSNSAVLYLLVGISNKALGNIEKAVIAYKKAISINPDYAEAYNNYGNALRAQSKLDEAIYAFKKALLLKPDFPEALCNIGDIFQKKGNFQEAIEAYCEAISIKPEYDMAFYHMGVALQNTVFNQPNSTLQKHIVSLLNKQNFVRPSDIAAACVSLLKCESIIHKHLNSNNPDSAACDPLEIIADLTGFPLLLKLMSICPLPDPELEILLTSLRARLLSEISSSRSLYPNLDFLNALALQCFTNEYIYNETQDEIEILQKLEKKLNKTFRNGQQPNPIEVLLLASYKPLYQYEWCRLLIVTDKISSVFTRQFEEPQKELHLKSTFAKLQKITDKVSLEVRAQYEDKPYPKWVNLGLPIEPHSISEEINKTKLKLYSNWITRIKSPNILVAGCGTGQHPITTATRFKGSKVLAIDLSLSSLSYAKRKTEELAINNIKFMQADILDMENIDEQFDIIECAGVLHHLKDPMKGWRILSSCLKAAGLMRVGLYSELARKEVAAIRMEINKLRIESTDNEMRYFRNAIMKSGKDHYKHILSSTDFYSFSTLKDLLFHVQEHNFTIPKLQDCLDNLGLSFCGFESDKIISHFEKNYKLREDLYDLDKWQEYENANPRTFTGMYQFWCQKINQ